MYILSNGFLESWKRFIVVIFVFKPIAEAEYFGQKTITFDMFWKKKYFLTPSSCESYGKPRILKVFGKENWVFFCKVGLVYVLCVIFDLKSAFWSPSEWIVFIWTNLQLRRSQTLEFILDSFFRFNNTKPVLNMFLLWCSKLSWFQ